ncbi:hypothetical protein STCU_00126 [Strigomonas culicis]|nr:hypothetical protein STCU_00126 [Strigomonas culicis]|eukprot:EPY37171.1 hypothetical protein STCU_00126 [Strigomonas culicis]
MGRSNNQLRRDAKKKGKTFVPKMVKSKTKNQNRKMKIMSLKKGNAGSGKMSYGKIKNKSGSIKDRKFKSGGYNFSGKFGKASGVLKKGGSGPSKKGK